MMTICISFMSMQFNLRIIDLTKSLMLFNGASVNYCEDILFSEVFEYFSSCLLTVEKYLPCVVCAHDNDTEVRRVEVDVDVEQELF